VSAVLWLLQRVSGLLLVGLAGLHVGVQYGLFPSPFRRPVLIGVDWLLLGLVLYHGFNGLRTIALDYIGGREGQRLVNRLLWILGLALFAYGGWGLAVMVW
jgi:succinate dehydrogenase hydrophobic anchor subunit